MSLLLLAGGFYIIIFSRRIHMRIFLFILRITPSFDRVYTRFFGWSYEDFINLRNEQIRNYPWVFEANVWIIRVVGILIAGASFSGLIITIIKWIG